MAFTLEDLLALPEDVQPEHAERAGLTVPPPAPAPALGPQPPAPIAEPARTPTSTVGPMPPEPIVPIDGKKFFSGLEKHPRMQFQPVPAAPDIQKDFSPNAGLGSVEATEQATKLPTLNFKQRQHLPTFSQGVPVNSEQFFNNKRERIEDQDQNPMGSAENHPGWLGKVAHVAGKIGNVAGEIIDPSATAHIPESDLGRRALEDQYTEQGDVAGKAEVAKEAEATKERQEDTREQHEENMRQRQLVLEEQGNQKIDALFQGLSGKEKKTANDKEKWLAAIGKKPNPDDPDGPPIDIPDEEMSPKQQQQIALLRASVHAREAKAAYDEYKANPNSPQAQATLEKAHAATIAAKAAAERAGIQHSRYLADILGEDENGKPLAGVELTDDNRPVGIKVSGAAGKGVTNSTRTMAEFARTVLPQMQVVKGKVTNLASALGPAVGRWNELMTNKGGADFPEFAGLDQDLDLLASAIVRTHFGARGGSQYREALRKNFGEAQSPDDLLARIDAAQGWIQGYAESDQASGKKRHVGDANTPPKPGAGTGAGGNAAPEKIDPKNPPDGAIRVHKKSGQQDRYDLKTKTWQPIQSPAAAQH